MHTEVCGAARWKCGIQGSRSETAAVACCDFLFRCGCVRSQELGQDLTSWLCVVLVLVAVCRTGGAPIGVLDGFFVFPEWKLIQVCLDAAEWKLIQVCLDAAAFGYIS